ncbi:MAG: PqiC family protein [Rhodobacter sp.]|nr:PqiC family protein [Rhodobacter sp.]
MQRLPLFSAILASTFLAGCLGTPEPLRYPVPVVKPTEKVRIPYRTVEVREVSLPAYAELSEMTVETAEGGIETARAQLWADSPVRAVTLELSRNLGQITGATVASEPWPFDSTADAIVEVRIEEMLTDRQNNFKLSGQYFVGSTDGSERNRARVFQLSVPLTTAPDPFAMAAARGQIIADLALLIARNGLK